MDDLLAKIRAARESWVTVGGLEFLIRRPTQMDAARLQVLAAASADLNAAAFDMVEQTVRMCVVGWRLKESDLIGAGGGALEVPFNTDLLIEWAKDRNDVFVPLYDECKRVKAEFEQKKASTEKNS